MSTRPRDRVLDLRLPCAYCAGNRTAETLKVHNERCAAHGERSYAPFLKAATLGFMAGLCFVVGCGRTPTGPFACPPYTVTDTVAVAGSSVAVRCLPRPVG